MGFKRAVGKQLIKKKKEEQMHQQNHVKWSSEESKNIELDMIESDWKVLESPSCWVIQDDLYKEVTFEVKPQWCVVNLTEIREKDVCLSSVVRRKEEMSLTIWRAVQASVAES